MLLKKVLGAPRSSAADSLFAPPATAAIPQGRDTPAVPGAPPASGLAVLTSTPCSQGCPKVRTPFQTNLLMCQPAPGCSLVPELVSLERVSPLRSLERAPARQGAGSRRLCVPRRGATMDSSQPLPHRSVALGLQEVARFRPRHRALVGAPARRTGTAGVRELLVSCPKWHEPFGRIKGACGL